VVRVPGYRSRGPGFDSIRGPLGLVRIIEELLERKVAAPVYKIEINGRGIFLIVKKILHIQKRPRQYPSGLL
jgi:hypothetical protein